MSRSLASRSFLVVLLLGLAAAEPVAASTRVNVYDPVTEGRGSPGSIYVIGDDSDSRIQLRRSGNGALVVEDNGPVTSPRCSRLDANRVRCPFPYDELTIYGYGGSDRIVIAADLDDSSLSADGGGGPDVLLGGGGTDFLHGGRGDDWLDGRGGTDFLYGDFDLPGPGSPGRGNDVLHGGAGDDRVGDYADPGRDRLFGDGGDDQLMAADESIDRSIDCGSGVDRYRTDRDDPRSLRCEVPDPNL